MRKKRRNGRVPTETSVEDWPRSKNHNFTLPEKLDQLSAIPTIFGSRS
jgi:hypothetical protein